MARVWGLQVSGAVRQGCGMALCPVRGAAGQAQRPAAAACTERWLQQLEPVRLACHMAVLHRPLADMQAMRRDAKAWMMGL